MKLNHFRVKNFRSINDSGVIEIDRITSLVGRNESGKTNLLLALYNLNPADKTLQSFTFEKDFPRDRSRKDFSDNNEVVETFWELSTEEMEWCKSKFGLKKDFSVNIKRLYKPNLIIDYNGLADKDFIKKDGDNTINIKKELDSYVSSLIPKFFFLDEYPIVEGHMDIDDFLRKSNPDKKNNL